MEEISFGKWLSRQRKSLGFTQKQLANLVNCAIITLRKIEGEQRRPSLQLAKRLALVLNIPKQEHDAFYKFARQNDLDRSIASTTSYPWQLSTSPIHLPGLSAMLSQMRNSRYLSNASGIYLDEHVYLVNQNDIPAEINLAALPLEITSTQAIGINDTAVIVLLVPVELPASLVRNLFANLGKNNSADRSLLH